MVFLKTLIFLTIFVPSSINGLNFHTRHVEFKKQFLARFSDTQSFLTEQWFSQKLDHFNKNDDTEWKQRFWQNDAYYNNGTEIQFLWIGGEGAEEAKFIEDEVFPMVEYAKRVNACLWSLEHRFYGQSRPKKDLSVENLKYLNGRQALEDLANFIKTKNKELNLKNPKWVVFGGSYPGSLALWMRQKYPDLVVGAIGSSGPMKIVVDFPEYLEVIEDSYRSSDSKCVDSIRDSFKLVDSLLKTKKGQDKLDKILNLHPSIKEQHGHLNEDQLENLFESLAEALTTQYSSLSQIESICEIMEDEKLDLVERLYESTYGKGSINYKGDIEKYRDVSFDSEYADSRAWIWQTCNEFGWFPTTRYKKSIFGQHVQLSLYYDTCMDTYGKEYNEKYVNEAVKKSVKFYGTREDYSATNVIITHGSIDPWNAIGIHKSNNPSMITIMINGTSHCEDLLVITSLGELEQAQKVTFENIQKWIGE